MTSTITNLLVDDLAKQLGDRHFFTVQDLKNMGFFGSTHAARQALKNGKLAYVKISQRRCVIPRSAIFDYLNKNLTENV